MIPGDLLSAFPHRQFHTLPGLLDSWAALPNSYPNALQGGSLYHFYDGLWYDPAWRRTHDLLCERRKLNDSAVASLSVWGFKSSSRRSRTVSSEIQIWNPNHISVESLCVRGLATGSQHFLYQ